VPPVAAEQISSCDNKSDLAETSSLWRLVNKSTPGVCFTWLRKECSSHVPHPTEKVCDRQLALGSHLHKQPVSHIFHTMRKLTENTQRCRQQKLRKTALHAAMYRRVRMHTCTKSAGTTTRPYLQVLGESNKFRRHGRPPLI